jgi:PAS domain S-box-containing protein
VERTFGRDELIVSKTDTRGLITYANGVFLRVAQYEEDQLIGRPHNIVRHPDMPRCIFKLMWDTIKGGNEIFAYVKNMAADGAHYWVLAHVTPSYCNDEIVGYHSNRRWPRPSAVREIEALYSSLSAEEKRHRDPRAAMDASGRALAALLDRSGRTYDEFIWDLIDRAEVA